MTSGPHVGVSAAWIARTIDFLGIGTASLVWSVDLIACPLTEAEWLGYLGRLKAVLHALPSGTNPVCIRLRYAVCGAPVETDIHLPVPDVAAGFVHLCSSPPPVGRWLVEPAAPGQMDTHRRGGPSVPPDFCQDMPF